jgi:uncharacterized membrane protein
MVRWLVSSRGVVTTVRASLGLVVIFIVAMPAWEALGFGDGVRSAFAPYCHQRFDRSFDFAGAVLPVCARCTGLWTGALAGALLLPLLRPARTVPRLGWLLAAAAPMALDLAIEHLAGGEPRAWSRALTGLCLGAAIVAFVMPALVRAGEEMVRTCETRSSTSRA